MPDTLTGLLLFVVLLLPGFAYLVGKERHGTERQLSSFREPAAIVAVSVTSEIVILVAFTAIRALFPSATPDVGALIRNSGEYLRGDGGHAGHYASVGLCGVVLLALATLLAYLATVPSVRRRFKWITGEYPHESTVSAWWIILEQWSDDRQVELACLLDDGSAIRGRYGSFNTRADDSPERDLILKYPIYYRPPGDDSRQAHWPASATCCSASRIVSLWVYYIESSTEPANPPRSVAADQTASPVTALKSEESPSAVAPTAAPKRL